MRIHVAATLAAAVVACGGNALDPGSGDDPGTGSHTLFVDADVHAAPIITNPSSGDGFQTSFSVSVRKNDLVVTAGEVTVSSNGGVASLVFDTSMNRWRGTQAGYHEVYELSVTSGDDFVSGVRVDGPSLHRFAAPLPGATVDATVPLAVRWGRDEAADVAVFDTEEMDTIEIADSGSFTVPVGGLKSNRDQTEEERLRLDRHARVTPAGAVAGSSVRVEVRNEISLIVAATGP